MGMSRTKISKGMLVGDQGWWFVVVNAVWDESKLWLQCICDNANNVYSFEPHEVDVMVSLEALGNNGWEMVQVPEAYRDREFPYGVVTEVLSGRHDDRWDD